MAAAFARPVSLLDLQNRDHILQDRETGLVAKADCIARFAYDGLVQFLENTRDLVLQHHFLVKDFHGVVLEEVYYVMLETKKDDPNENGREDEPLVLRDDSRYAHLRRVQNPHYSIDHNCGRNGGLHNANIARIQRICHNLQEQNAMIDHVDMSDVLQRTLFDATLFHVEAAHPAPKEKSVPDELHEQFTRFPNVGVDDADYEDQPEGPLNYRVKSDYELVTSQVGP